MCEKGGRAHTPITSASEQRKFGAELSRREAGKKPKMPGITTEELRAHLEESKGKKLPEVHHKSKSVLG